ncbi:MAG: 2-hydroxyglutaryl-CoA dehydratase [Deltaproteobacteria bacterium]|nr:2-hydroxyglutaryl-CoA dehydratase [Deltaproteobacteria bacterium]
MITLGCDVGSLFTKAVILDDDAIAAERCIPTTGNATEDVAALIADLLADAGLDRGALAGLAATGGGADLVAQAEHTDEAVTCVGWAAREYLEDVDVVIDVGGQSITSILLDEAGEVVDFMRNDKCASGSGRFLDVMSAAVGVSLEQLDEVVATANEPAKFSSQCGVFVESEVITHVNAGVAPANIVAGLCDAVARIVSSQARRFGQGKTYTLTGGVARIRSVADLIGQRLDGRYQPFPLDPQLTAAVGAALLASPE